MVSRLGKSLRFSSDDTRNISSVGRRPTVPTEIRYVKKPWEHGLLVGRVTSCVAEPHYFNAALAQGKIIDAVLAPARCIKIKFLQLSES
jgi:hypothetical protein